MGLFSRKKDKLESAGKAKILDKKVMKEFQTKDLSDVEHIIRTTDSMHLVASAKTSSDDANAKLLGATKDAVARNYELARKRIITTYQDIFNSGNYISVPFLTIQINLINFEKKWSVKHIQRVIESFNKGIVEEVSKGKSVALSERLVIEPVEYVNKVIPSTTVISNIKEVVNGYTWEELISLLIKKHKLSNLDIEVVEEYINLLDTNIEQGYYVKIDKFIITRIRVGEPTTILLFSNETLREVNHIYISQKKKSKEQTVSRTNMIDHFQKTQDQIEEDKKKSSIVQDVKELDDFVPNDDVSDEEEKRISTKRSIELEKKLVEKKEKDSKAKESKKEAPAEKVAAKKPAAKKTAAKKPAAKKAPAKKTAAKKPAAKKAPAKKTAAKKPAAKKATAKKTAAKKK